MYESKVSQTVTLEFDAMGDVDDLRDLTMEKFINNTVLITWSSIRGVDGYIVKQRLPIPYPEPKLIKVTNTNLTCNY